jgi:hypothetical protein
MAKGRGTTRCQNGPFSDCHRQFVYWLFQQNDQPTAPAFVLDEFELPDDAAILDQMILDLHHSSADTGTAALSLHPDVATRLLLQNIQQIDHNRFPNPK